MFKTKTNVKALVCVAGVIVLAVLFGLIITNLVYCGNFYVHEAGHIVFGYLGNVLYGGSMGFEISKWVKCPLIPLFKMPQQTRIVQGEVTGSFVFGGAVMVVLVALFISFWFYKWTKNWLYWLFPVIFIWHEFFGNFLCGTDNLAAKPFPICAENWIVGNAVKFAVFGLWLLIVFLLFKKFKSVLAKNWLKT